MKKLIVLSLALVSAVNVHNAFAMEGMEKLEKKEKQEIGIRDLPVDILLEEIGGYLLIPTEVKKGVPALTEGVFGHEGIKLTRLQEAVQEAKQAYEKLSATTAQLTVANNTKQNYTLDLAKGFIPGVMVIDEDSTSVRVLGTVPSQSSKQFIIPSSDEYKWGARLFDAQNNYFGTVVFSETSGRRMVQALFRDNTGSITSEKQQFRTPKQATTKPFRVDLRLSEDTDPEITIEKV